MKQICETVYKTNMCGVTFNSWGGEMGSSSLCVTNMWNKYVKQISKHTKQICVVLTVIRGEGKWDPPLYTSHM